MVIFYKKLKVLWNSIDKEQNGLEQSKNDKSATLPWYQRAKFYSFGSVFLKVGGTAPL